MSNAWEVTPDDVLNVIHSMGMKVTGDQAQTIHNDLDQFEIENAALHGDTIEEQTKYSYEEIKRQIERMNLCVSK